MTKSDDVTLIEYGWLGFRTYVIGPDESPGSVDLSRDVYFAGARYMYGTLMRLTRNATETNLRHLEAIRRELDEFMAETKRRASEPD